MTKLISITLAFISTVLFITCPNIRVAQGEVTARMYIEEGDYMNTTLTTTDGEAWIAENYTAPIGDSVLIIYDMCDKSTLYDDEILYIIHFTDFK